MRDLLSLLAFFDHASESEYCSVLNESGQGFADETTGDGINQDLAKQDKRRGFI